MLCWLQPCPCGWCTNKPDSMWCGNCSGSHTHGEQGFTEHSAKVGEPRKTNLRGQGSALHRPGNPSGYPPRSYTPHPSDFCGSSLRSPENSGSKRGFSSLKWILGTTLGPVFWQTSSGVDPGVLWLDRDEEELLPFPLRLCFEVFALYLFGQAKWADPEAEDEPGGRR